MNARPTEAELDRARRRSHKFLAFDRLAELHGQAEWQRFRREHPFCSCALSSTCKPALLACGWMSIGNTPTTPFSAASRYRSPAVLDGSTWDSAGASSRATITTYSCALRQRTWPALFSAKAASPHESWFAKTARRGSGTKTTNTTRHKTALARARYRDAVARPANSVAPAELDSGRKTWQSVVTRMVSESGCRAGTWRLEFSRRTFEPRDDFARAQWSHDHSAC